MSEKSSASDPEIITFGCRLNIYESEVIMKNAKKAGIQNTTFINSCSVTSEAERKVQQTIRKVKRKFPNKRIIVTGCAAQVNPEKYKNMPEVSGVIGNEEKMQDKSYFELKNKDVALVNDIMSIKETALHMVDSFDKHVKGFIQVQNGCNHRCTFCQIPYARGNSRSVPLGEIVSQSRRLIEGGCKELVITGVDITGYGSDLPGEPKLGQTLKRMLHILPDLKRLRISSIDVAEVDDALFDLMANNKTVMPYIHLSLQSGDNMILKRMKRRHNREQVIEFCKAIKKARPEITIGSDIICGFPTETEQMFQNTVDLIQECNIIHNHIFPYSEREDTPAARMPQVDRSIRKERSKSLGSVAQAQLLDHYKKQVGKTVNVLVEQNNRGRSEDYSLVHFSSTVKPGEIARATVSSVDTDNCALICDDPVLI